jgi:hypothetical protein
MSQSARVHPDDITLIADAVADRLRDEAVARRGGGLSSDRTPRGERLLTAAQLAECLGVEVNWVYRHKTALDVLPLGSGPKPRLRFPEKVAHMLAARTDDKKSSAVQARVHTGPARRTASGAPLLPIRTPGERPNQGPDRI